MQNNPSQLFIDGQWTNGAAEASLDVINPATENIIATLPEASLLDAENAISAAKRAFNDGMGPWPSMDQKERAKILHKFCDIMEANVEEMCQISRSEIGAAQALEPVQVHWGIQLTREWADRTASFDFIEPLPPAYGPMGGAGQSSIFKEPIGVVSAITPFNFPILLNLWKIGPCLGMGNTMVLKPSPYTPQSALVLARYAAEAGVPEGVFNVITGGNDVGELLTTHPDVAMVSFTGSDVIGSKVMAQASEGIKRVVLELGGKSANVLFEDANLDDPNLMMALASFTAHCGQGCALYTRILVHESIHDEVVARIQGVLQQINVGDPADASVSMGPLIREAQRSRVEGFVEQAIAEGAELVCGGKRPSGFDKGFFYEPTLFTGVNNSMKIAQEEVFGPVGVVIPFSDTDEAIRIANDSAYGLAGSVWSQDTGRALKVARSIRAGLIGINGGSGGLGSIGKAPFGGYKRSGLGREHGDAGAHEFLELKTIEYPIG